jgi:1,2-dihydroxy-3-keto-5-methylthiopentene dioxygenase
MRAWKLEIPPGADIRQPHAKPGGDEVSLVELNALGVLYQYFAPSDYDKSGTETHARWLQFRSDHGFKYADVLEVSPEQLPDFESKLQMFFEEHIHADPEVRYVTAGSGYFDVRDESDSWIRIAVEPGDMLVLPAGIYHRFTVDSSNYIRAVRLFADEPQWVPINRTSAERHPARLAYEQLYPERSFSSEPEQQALRV